MEKVKRQFKVLNEESGKWEVKERTFNVAKRAAPPMPKNLKRIDESETPVEPAAVSGAPAAADTTAASNVPGKKQKS